MVFLFNPGCNCCGDECCALTTNQDYLVFRLNFRWSDPGTAGDIYVIEFKTLNAAYPAIISESTSSSFTSTYCVKLFIGDPGDCKSRILIRSGSCPSPLNESSFDSLSSGTGVIIELTENTATILEANGTYSGNNWSDINITGVWGGATAQPLGGSWAATNAQEVWCPTASIPLPGGISGLVQIGDEFEWVVAGMDLVNLGFLGTYDFNGTYRSTITSSVVANSSQTNTQGTLTAAPNVIATGGISFWQFTEDGSLVSVWLDCFAANFGWVIMTESGSPDWIIGANSIEQTTGTSDLYGGYISSFTKL